MRQKDFFFLKIRPVLTFWNSSRPLPSPEFGRRKRHRPGVIVGRSGELVSLPWRALEALRDSRLLHQPLAFHLSL